MTFIKTEPQRVAWETWLWFQTFDEWPLPIELHHHIAWLTGYPLEHAEHDVLNALNADVVLGVPSIVLMRQGEANGNWTDPFRRATAASASSWPTSARSPPARFSSTLGTSSHERLGSCRSQAQAQRVRRLRPTQAHCLAAGLPARR